MNIFDARTLLILASIVFNIGGFFWLARNHFHTVNNRLETIEQRMGHMEVVVGRIEALVNERRCHHPS